MPRILAVQWDQQRIRFAVAETGRRGSASLSAAGVADVESGDDALCDRIGRTLKGIVTGHKAEKARVVIALARGSVDVAHLALPMAEDAELPQPPRAAAVHAASAEGELQRPPRARDDPHHPL